MRFARVILNQLMQMCNLSTLIVILFTLLYSQITQADEVAIQKKDLDQFVALANQLFDKNIPDAFSILAKPNVDLGITDEKLRACYVQKTTALSYKHFMYPQLLKYIMNHKKNFYDELDVLADVASLSDIGKSNKSTSDRSVTYIQFTVLDEYSELRELTGFSNPINELTANSLEAQFVMFNALECGMIP